MSAKPDFVNNCLLNQRVIGNDIVYGIVCNEEVGQTIANLTFIFTYFNLRVANDKKNLKFIIDL